MKKTLLSAVITYTLLTTVSAAADTDKKLSLGVGIGYQQKPFIGDDSNWIPIPHVEYNSGLFFIKGLKLGLDLLKYDKTTADVHLKYQSLSFKPSDAYGVFKQLNRRKETILLGTGISHKFDNNTFVSAEINGDILGRSKGLNADISVGYIYKIADDFIVTSKAGLTWDSAKHNRYYYGVSKSESRRTGIDAYRPNSTITPYIDLGIVVKATDRFHVFGGVEVRFLPNKIKNSPITNRSTLSSFAFGINYDF